jgi:hypothetical protein
MGSGAFRTSFRCSIGAGLAALLAPLALQSESTAAVELIETWGHPSSSPGIVYSLWDDPGPFPARWEAYRQPGPEHLNPQGDEAGDGEPDFGWNAGEGRFEVVWSRVLGPASEVVWSRSTNGGWSAPSPLSRPSGSDLLPRVSFTGQGDTALTFRRDDGSVRYRERRAGSDAWGETVSLTGGTESAGRPDLADPGDGVRVAYPLAEAGGGWSIVVETRIGASELPPDFTRELLALSAHPPDPEVRAEAQGGLLWVTWVHDEASLGWSRLEAPGWTPPELVPVEGGDRDRARFLAKRAALRSP